MSVASRMPTQQIAGCGPQPASELGGGLYFPLGKRALDVLGALVGLVLSSPILFLCGVAIWLDSPGVILYHQERVGRHGWPFRIIKLRTMTAGADRQGSKITVSGDTRITRVGQFLRQTKLDEIPQLLNVLRGEMSLVGPRPEVPEYVALYTSAQRHVLVVRPGLTGPASLAFIDEERVLGAAPEKENFYRQVVMPAKLNLDLAYCRSISLLGDLKLLLRTTARTMRSTMNRARLPNPPTIICAGNNGAPALPAQGSRVRKGSME